MCTQLFGSNVNPYSRENEEPRKRRHWVVLECEVSTEPLHENIQWALIYMDL